MKIIQNINFSQKSVLLIVDYNVSTVKLQSGYTFKIESTLETINFIKSQNPSVLYILTHLGRPRSKHENKVDPIYAYLKNIFMEIQFISIEKYQSNSNGLIFGDNARYYSKDELVQFYKSFDLIVNDAFGTIHRDLDVKCYAGLLMQKELNVLGKLDSFDLVIMGGAKDKIKNVEKFDSKVFLGGLLALEFMKGLGYQVGIVEKELKAPGLIKRLEEENQRIFLPIDFYVKDKSNGKVLHKRRDEINEDDRIIDIGEESFEILKNLIRNSKRILWNGPLGKFEEEDAVSTRKLVKVLEESKAKVVIGGGESSLAVQKYSKIENFYHVSTGGGAMLSFLNDKDLPGTKSFEW